MASCSEQIPESFMKFCSAVLEEQRIRDWGTDGRTDGRTNERTDIRITIYLCNFLCGGYKNQYLLDKCVTQYVILILNKLFGSEHIPFLISPNDLMFSTLSEKEIRSCLFDTCRY